MNLLLDDFCWETSKHYFVKHHDKSFFSHKVEEILGGPKVLLELTLDQDFEEPLVIIDH